MLDDISNAIRSKEPARIREQVVTRIDGSLRSLSDLLPPTGARRSARDVIAHWRTLRAGTFNLSRGDGGYFIGFFSGEQDLGPWDSRTSVRTTERRDGEMVIGVVSPPLRGQVVLVEEMMFGVYKEMGLLP